MEPGARLDASMEDSESQILQPLDPVSTSETWPMKADLPISEGYWLEASSRMLWKSSSRTWESEEEINEGVLGDADGSEFESLEGVFDCFLAFEGISSFKT